MEQISQTVVVLNIEDGLAKGSARSLESINIFHALDDHRDIFTAFGGHAGAAGMTLPEENLTQLSDILCSYVYDNDIDTSAKNTLNLDEELQLGELSLDTIRSLEKLAPFGMDNKKPVFWLHDITVTQARTMGQNGAHLKFKVKQGKASFDVVAFNKGHLLQEFQQAQGLELAVTLSVNVWNGQTTLQLMLADVRVDNVQLFDFRSKNMVLPEGLPTVEEASDEATAVVLDTLPNSETELKEWFDGKEFQAIYFKNRIKEAYYLTGYGTREQFARLYKTIYQFPEFDVRYKLDDLSHYLKIDKILLIKMIQIFDELGFVTIDNGVMTVNKEAGKRDIEESKIFQDLKRLVKFQELMALGTPQEIYDWLYKQDQ